MSVLQLEAKDGGSGATSLTWTLTATASGSGLCVGGWTNTGTITEITDSTGGSLTGGQWTARLNSDAILWADRLNAPSGITSVIVMFSASMVGDFVCFEDDELQAFDQPAYAEVGASTAPSSGNTPNVAYSNDIAFGVFGTFSGDSISYGAGSGWTPMAGTGLTGGVHANTTDNNEAFFERRVLGVSGAGYAATATCGSSYQYAAIIAYQPKITTQTAVPNADVSAGAWTPSTGSTLYGPLADASDSTYDSTTSNSAMRVGLQTLSTPKAGTQTAAFRASGSPAKKLIVRLIEGASTLRGSTTIDPLTSTLTAYSFSPSGISNYADLDMEFEVADATTAPGGPAYQSLGTAATGTTTCSPSYPSMTGATSATALYLFITGRSNTANTAPAITGGGWTLVGQLEGGTGTWASGTGTRRVDVYRKTTVTGSESGTITVTLSGSANNTLRAQIMRVDAPVAGYTLTEVWTSGSDTTNGTGYSAAGSSSLAIAPNDLIVTVTAQNLATGTGSSRSVTATGITFGTLTNVADASVTNGNQHRSIINTIPVNSGSATVAPTYAYTISASGSGPTGFMRVRAAAPSEFARVAQASFTVPLANTDVTITTTTGNATAAGTTARIDNAVNVGAGPGNTVAAGATARIDQSRSIPSGPGNAVADGQAARIDQQRAVAAGPGNAVADGVTASINRAVVIAASIGNAVADGVPAAISQSAVIAAGPGNAVAAGATARIDQHRSIGAGPGNAQADGVTARIMRDVTIPASPGNAVADGIPAQIVVSSLADERRTLLGGGRRRSKWPNASEEVIVQQGLVHLLVSMVVAGVFDD